MSESFRVGDDATVTYPVTDTEGGPVDWANPTVTAGDIEIAATWEGDPAPTRNLAVPITDLPVGNFTLWLDVPGGSDVLLGQVDILSETGTSVPDYGGCLWPLDPACLTEEWDTYEPAVQDRARGLASSTLVRLTGYRVANCPITVRPMLSMSACYLPPPDWDWYRPGFTTLNWGGDWRNCACPPDLCEFSLPAPVGRVDQIKVDGTVVPPEDYRVDGNRIIYMGTGDCPWPRTQDLSRPDTEDGTFSVTYLNAYPVDSLGAYAAGVLSMQYARACTGAANCKLPRGVTTIVKQGVQMEISSGAFPDGLTGIREVDTYIALWNPRGNQQATTVWSPDIPRVGR